MLTLSLGTDAVVTATMEFVKTEDVSMSVVDNNIVFVTSTAASIVFTSLLFMFVMPSDEILGSIVAFTVSTVDVLIMLSFCAAVSRKWRAMVALM